MAEACPGHPALSVIVPALNEQENLELLLPALRETLQGLGVSYEIIVVDGGSHDETAEAALQAAALRDRMHPDPLIQLGRLFALKDDKAKALEAYRQALRLDPSNVTAVRAVEELAASLYGGS